MACAGFGQVARIVRRLSCQSFKAFSPSPLRGGGGGRGSLGRASFYPVWAHRCQPPLRPVGPSLPNIFFRSSRAGGQAGATIPAPGARPGLTITTKNGAIFPARSQPGAGRNRGQPPPGTCGILRLRLLGDIVHGFKGFGKADFVLTKPGGRDKQNTWEAG